MMCVWRKRPPIATASVVLCAICLFGTSLVFGSSKFNKLLLTLIYYIVIFILIMYYVVFFWTLEVDNGGCLTRYWLFVIGFTTLFRYCAITYYYMNNIGINFIVS